MTDLEQREIIRQIKFCQDEHYRVRFTLKSGNVVGGPETLVYSIDSANGFIQLVTSWKPKEGKVVSNSSFAHIAVSHIDFFESLGK